MPNRQQGFTLLEVLIALTLMAVLSVMSWRALDITARSSERLHTRSNDTLALVRMLGQLESDLSRRAGADVLAALPASAAGRPPAAGPGPTLVSRTGEIMLPGVRWTPPHLTVQRSAQRGTWQEVVWTLNGNTLRRAAGPAVQVLPLPRGQDPELILTGVRAFTVRAWLPGQGWADTVPDAVGSNATGLEIAVERRHEGHDETYRKVVLLP